MNPDENPGPGRDPLLAALGQLPPIEPAADLQARFRDRLETDRSVGPLPHRWISAALAAVLIGAIGAGWWVDRQHEAREVEQLRAQIAAMPVIARFEWVSSATASAPSDPRVVGALTTALLTDSSTNVRVAAAEALGRLAPPAALRRAAERSIASDPSPFVQTAVLGLLARLPRPDRAALLRSLLARPDLDPVVRAEAERRSRS